jgi:hypothetical protein
MEPDRGDLVVPNDPSFPYLQGGLMMGSTASLVGMLKAVSLSLQPEISLHLNNISDHWWNFLLTRGIFDIPCSLNLYIQLLRSDKRSTIGCFEQLSKFGSDSPQRRLFFYPLN